MKSGAAPQNLLKYSEQLDIGGSIYGGWNYSISGIDCMNDLEGNSTMEEITLTADGAWRYQNAFNWVTVTGSTTYRFSFDVRKGTMTNVSYMAYDYTNNAVIDLHEYTAQISDLETRRVSFEFTTPSTCVAIALYLIEWESSNSGTIYLGRLQLETNGSAYVKTTSSIIP